MDDILASIRRILDDDQAAPASSDNVLMLDPSMMVEEGAPTPAGKAEQAMPTKPKPQLTVEDCPSIAGDESTVPTADMNDDIFPPTQPEISRDAPPNPATFVAPEAVAAAATSVGALMRTLAAERSAVISRGSVTIEDLVREEVKPLLKQWLDAHLPPIVERAVRAEIERVVSRQTG